MRTERLVLPRWSINGHARVDPYPIIYNTHTSKSTSTRPVLCELTYKRTGKLAEQPESVQFCMLRLTRAQVAMKVRISRIFKLHSSKVHTLALLHFKRIVNYNCNCDLRKDDNTSARHCIRERELLLCEK